MSSFSFTGTYRAEGRPEPAPSTLRGHWSSPGALLDDSVNAALRAHPQWQREAVLALRPAVVTTCSGELAREPDALYRRERFTPRPSTPPLPADIVDVGKCRARWEEQERHLRAVVSDRTHSEIVERLHDLDVVIANEAMVHEAGYLVGYDVRRKHADGYFSASGRMAWPLVYLEELRADLHGFGLAVSLLPPERAVQILLYTVARRFGVHREGLTTRGVAPEGLAPFLLFSLLRELGAMAVSEIDGRVVLRLVTLEAPWLYRVMIACADHAQTQITALELATSDPLRRALGAARYVRARLCDGAAVDAYARVMQPIPPIARSEPHPRSTGLRNVLRTVQPA